MARNKPEMKACPGWVVTMGVAWMIAGGAGVAWGQTSTPAGPSPEPDFLPVEKVTEGYTKVVSTADGQKSFYTIYRRDKDQQLLSELPKGFAGQRHYIALTVASGESYAGLQAGERYVYWKRYGTRLALVEPNVEIRSTGDAESKSSVKRLFTDRVLLDVPILALQKNGGPLIDLDALLIGNADTFFGSSARGLNGRLVTVQTCKAFPENIEVSLEAPTSGGQLRTFHYSISLIPDNEDYKPRVADERVGYFTTSYTDYGKFKEDETAVRYINRWHIEKADANLKLSPPKEPIVFYIEHTTPVRYRRWVRQGIEMWNRAFENVGIVGAIEVRQQDASSSAHMDKDPEDVRHNFVRWLNNGVGTAIGPSRVNPMTGQILDADIVLTDGWIRYWWMQYNEILPELAMEGFSPETMAWLYRNPRWDPRVRLAPPSQRDTLLAQRARTTMPALGGHALGEVDTSLIGGEEYDGLMSRYSQKNGLCMAANCKSHGLAMMQMALAVRAAEAGGGSGGGDASGEDGDKDEEAGENTATKPTTDEQLIDGIPESFIGPLLADLVAHEVGHTLGLRHNFKASSVYGFGEINSEKLKGSEPFAGSVMDYIPVNMNAGGGEVQGDFGMIRVGPYDEWAIAYGYTLESDLKPILDRVAEPALAYATDEDTWGPDPLARRYDFGKDPLTYARDQMQLVGQNRKGILEKFVEDGQSWSKARRGYLLTLAAQTKALSMMSNWVGGTFIYRDKKGDKNGRAPIEVVPADDQRAALDFVVKNAFHEDAFGLTPELLRHMTVDKWWDGGNAGLLEDPAWPVHDRVLGIQASVLTALMNPTTLARVYDNEFRVPAEEDALTLPEILATLRGAIVGDLAAKANAEGAQFTARQPMLGSLTRNLQKEYVERLIDLIKPDAGLTAAHKPIATLAAVQLEEVKASIDQTLGNEKIDPYTKAHLASTSKQIGKALDADYVFDVSNPAGALPLMFFFGQDAAQEDASKD